MGQTTLPPSRPPALPPCAPLSLILATGDTPAIVVSGGDCAVPRLTRDRSHWYFSLLAFQGLTGVTNLFAEEEKAYIPEKDRLSALIRDLASDGAGGANPNLAAVLEELVQMMTSELNLPSGRALRELEALKDQIERSKMQLAQDMLRRHEKILQTYKTECTKLEMDIPDIEKKLRGQASNMDDLAALDLVSRHSAMTQREAELQKMVTWLSSRAPSHFAREAFLRTAPVHTAPVNP